MEEIYLVMESHALGEPLKKYKRLINIHSNDKYLINNEIGEVMCETYTLRNLDGNFVAVFIKTLPLNIATYSRSERSLLIADINRAYRNMWKVDDFCMRVEIMKKENWDRLITTF